MSSTIDIINNTKQTKCVPTNECVITIRPNMAAGAQVRNQEFKIQIDNNICFKAWGY